MGKEKVCRPLTRIEKSERHLRSKARGKKWYRKMMVLPAWRVRRIKTNKKMCAWDIILVKLQIMFKANIYKEDWHEECAERMSGSGQQSFRIAQ